MQRAEDENGMSLPSNVSLTCSSAPVGTESSLIDYREDKNKSKSQNVTDIRANSPLAQLLGVADVCLFLKEPEGRRLTHV